MQLFSADATMFSKKIFFAHKKLKKPPSKVAHNRPKPFISQPSPTHSQQPKINFSYHKNSVVLADQLTLFYPGGRLFGFSIIPTTLLPPTRIFRPYYGPVIRLINLSFGLFVCMSITVRKMIDKIWLSLIDCPAKACLLRCLDFLHIFFQLKFRTSNFCTRVLLYNSLPESQCDGDFDIL